MMTKWKHNFRELAFKRNHTIKDIARQTGISKDVLYTMNRDPYYNLTKDTIGKLCDFFGVEPGDLIVSENGNNPSPLDTPSVEKLTNIKVNNLESIVEYVRRLPMKEREAVEGIYKRVLETVVMAMEK
jgi:DNA-binding Xre family transcriptional regulator